MADLHITSGAVGEVLQTPNRQHRKPKDDDTVSTSSLTFHSPLRKHSDDGVHGFAEDEEEDSLTPAPNTNRQATAESGLPWTPDRNQSSPFITPQLSPAPQSIQENEPRISSTKGSSLAERPTESWLLKHHDSENDILSPVCSHLPKDNLKPRIVNYTPSKGTKMHGSELIFPEQKHYHKFTIPDADHPYGRSTISWSSKLLSKNSKQNADEEIACPHLVQPGTLHTPNGQYFTYEASHHWKRQFLEDSVESEGGEDGESNDDSSEEIDKLTSSE